MKTALQKKNLIKDSKISIYDNLPIDNPAYLSDEELHYLLKKSLVGLSTKGMPNRTRSKVVKGVVCEALGYPIPKSFKKTQPRFTGQNFDTYIQKSNNLQIWNEEISNTRRYAILRVSVDDIIIGLRLITGHELQELDTTGTLTHKYQARVKELTSFPEIFSKTDTARIIKLLSKNGVKLTKVSPVELPKAEHLLPIDKIGKKLSSLIGFEFVDSGKDQERNRGGVLHAAVCKALGYNNYADNGKFPDILNQLLEVKLQVSTTIDLGLVLPTSTENFLSIEGSKIRHCDVRYVIFIGKCIKNKIRILNFALGCGEDFFKKFTQFKGKTLNKKIQLPLPRDFFDIG